MKTIVVGSDSSDTSLDAVRLAAELAAATGAALHVVCIASLAQDLAMHSIGPLIVPDNFDIEAIQAADAAVAQGGEVARERGVTAITHVLEGDAARELIAFCKEQTADVLVLGSHGMSGAARFLLGSIPDRCAHHATCSVLIARPK